MKHQPSSPSSPAPPSITASPIKDNDKAVTSPLRLSPQNQAQQSTLPQVHQQPLMSESCLLDYTRIAAPVINSSREGLMFTAARGNSRASPSTSSGSSSSSET